MCTSIRMVSSRFKRKLNWFTKVCFNWRNRIFKLFRQYIDHGLILWSVILKFDSCRFVPYLLASQVKKYKVAGPDVNPILTSKNEIIADVFYEDASTNDYLPYDSAHPLKNLSYTFCRT